MPKEITSLTGKEPETGIEVFEHFPVPVAIIGERHTIQQVNRAFCRLVGTESFKLVDKRVEEVLQSSEACGKLLDRVSRTSISESFTENEPSRSATGPWTYTVWPIAGSECLMALMVQVAESLEFHGNAVTMNEALIVGAVRQHELTEEARNFSARLQAEIAARQVTEKELAEKARLLDLTNDAIIVRGLDDRITLWNKGAEKLFGWTCQEVIHKHLHHLLQTDFPKPMQEIVKELYEKGDYAGEVTQIARDGRRIPSLCRWVLDRETHSILTSYTDITDRKAAAAALLESEERYRNLFNSIDEGFCVIEMIFDERDKPVDYRFLEVNPSFEKQSGLHRAAGRRMLELAPGHETHWFQMYGAVARTGLPIRFVNEAKAWGQRWFDTYAFRLGGSGSNKVAVLFTDITERKRNELALEHAKAELSRHALNLEGEVTERTAKLRDSVGSMETLTYTMAHDLRAPIRAMKGFATAMLEDVPLDATGKDYASRIHVAAERMDQLINDLLSYGQLTHLEFHLHPVDLKAQIESVLAQLSGEIQSSKGVIRVSDTIPIVVGNEVLLEQVLTNLVLNALKFVQPGKTSSINIQVERRDGHARLWIIDNGLGVDFQYHQKIFGMFNRLHTTDQYPGTGCGLAIVKRAVERMNGTVGVDSESGKGSHFWIELPMVG